MSAIGEVGLQLIGEFLVEYGFTSVREPFRERSRAHPVLAGFGVLLLGTIAGAVTVESPSLR